MMRWFRLLASAALVFTPATFAHSPMITPLSPAQLSDLLKPPVRGERVIMLWSLQCVYCEPNMRKLARLARAYPERVRLVLVSTDGITSRDKIAARLQQMHMQGYPARAYTDLTPTRMNYLIDPTWGGELPRTVLVRADGTRLGISGLLTPAQLRRIAPR